jgi:hypothetical protein
MIISAASLATAATIVSTTEGSNLQYSQLADCCVIFCHGHRL